MSKKIIFQATSSETELLFDAPSPALQHTPLWYKEMPVHLDGEEVTSLSPDGIGSSNLTLKGCMPFIDALGAGYIFTLPFDIELRKNYNGMISVRWATGVDLIGQHSLDQAPGLPVPDKGSPNILKWKPGWRVITPAGYSCLFTHPMNRTDLPFVTLSGIVDTDSYNLGVEFPFRLLDISKDIMIVEKGTPICQVLPFKREKWNSTNIKFDEQEYKKNGFILKSKIVRSYQSQFWKKKYYK